MSRPIPSKPQIPTTSNKAKEHTSSVSTVTTTISDETAAKWRETHRPAGESDEENSADEDPPFIAARSQRRIMSEPWPAGEKDQQEDDNLGQWPISHRHTVPDRPAAFGSTPGSTKQKTPARRTPVDASRVPVLDSAPPCAKCRAEQRH